MFCTINKTHEKLLSVCTDRNYMLKEYVVIKAPFAVSSKYH